MSSTITVGPTRGVRGIGLFTIIAGIVMILAGAATWTLIATQLADEEITVSADAPFMGGMFQGDRVIGPLTAFAQADVINHHALESTDGQTYAQLEQDDPRRETVMTASFLRSSLFTSVVSFGLSALVIGLGLLFILIGSALRKLSGGPEVSIAGPTPLTSDADTYGRHADPDGEGYRAPPAAAEYRTPPSDPAA